MVVILNARVKGLHNSDIKQKIAVARNLHPQMLKLTTAILFHTDILYLFFCLTLFLTKEKVY